ncbi:unnamed protein product, partial [Iphiclides podalirius]
MLEKGRQALMSAERPASDEEAACKWIPKKKHEVLKAKYKCLKKLFQIYDASVIGILPEPYAAPEIVERERKHSRRRRSHRTKTDACSGTNEIACDVEKRSIATAVIRDLKLQYTPTSIIDSDTRPETRRDKFTQDSRGCLSAGASEKECEYTQTSELLRMPYLTGKETKPKPTRFQMFLQRLLGIKRERTNHPPPTPHVYAASDNNINDRYGKRRKRGLRFRRLRGPKIHSETALRDGRNPVILNYVQSVQKNCLMDTTPRQCPFLGCRMIFYGIINYNDHLNLCHFTDRKYFCHYCHEGFVRDCDKLVHENEHIGITKLNAINKLASTPSSDRRSYKVASLTQTEPQAALDVDEEKLKKIVSFFDKIDDPEEILAELKRSRHSRSNMNLTRHSSRTEAATPEPRRSDRNTHGAYSSVQLRKTDRRSHSSGYSDALAHRSSASSLKCQMCGDSFDRKQRLNLHVDTEHRGHKQKYLSAMGSQRERDTSERLERCSVSTVRRVDTSSTLTQSPSEGSNKSCDPSTNIVYYTSLESVRKPSVKDFMAKHARSSFGYKWEPGTKASLA